MALATPNRVQLGFFFFPPISLWALGLFHFWLISIHCHNYSFWCSNCPIFRHCCLLSLDMTPFIFNCFLVFWPQQKVPGSSCTFLALEPGMNHFFREPGSFQSELELKKRSEMQNTADHWLPRTQGLPFTWAPWIWKLSGNLWGHWRSLALMTAATARHR